jgi:hypothetical protein
LPIEDAASFKRVEADDPTCCQGLNKFGPCNIQAVPGQKFCKLHFGIGNKVAEQKEARNYRLNKYQRRVNEFAENDHVKSLRDEVGILRLLMEETLNKCNSDTELLLYSSKIADLAVKIEKLVASCHKLELATGQLVNKANIMFLGDVIIQIIGEVCPPDKINDVSDRIMQTIMEINSGESAAPALQGPDQSYSGGSES